LHSHETYKTYRDIYDKDDDTNEVEEEDNDDDEDYDDYDYDDDDDDDVLKWWKDLCKLYRTQNQRAQISLHFTHTYNLRRESSELTLLFLCQQQLELRENHAVVLSWFSREHSGDPIFKSTRSELSEICKPAWSD